MIESLKPLYSIVTLNTRLFLNVLDGVDDGIGQTRLNSRANNLSFIAVHILDARYYLAQCLGLVLQNPLGEMLKAVQQVDDMTHYPPLLEIRTRWNEISEQIAIKMRQLPSEALAQKSELKFPVDDDTRLGAIAFLLQHESYHIGQLGWLRKSFGLGAMRYDLPPAT